MNINRDENSKSKRLMLHICCGPCSIYPIDVIQRDGFCIEGLFYNPNIHPEQEFLKRKQGAGDYCKLKQIDVMLMDDQKQSMWEDCEIMQNDQRCEACYAIRIGKTAQIANTRGFDAFSTSLLVSPYQKHEKIIEICQHFAEQYDILFYYRDFREGFRKGQQTARELGLYRQKYCGCILSLER